MTDTLTNLIRVRTARPNLRHYVRVWRSRRALARLERHLLRDIGISAQHAAEEAKRPIWDAPAPWRGVS